jgi:DNA N-6-adenine-methyltransferase (Dam)
MAEHEAPIGLSDDWWTPPEIFRALDRVFDLDPCSPGPGLGFVPARRIYTKADDGLAQPWHGLVWLNPPFGGRRGQVPWLKKFFAHGNGVALCAARTSADWFHTVVFPNAHLLLFPNGKTKFHRPDGSIGKEPGTGIVLIGIGDIACTALRRSGLGACVVVERTTTTQPPIDDGIPGFLRRNPALARVS